MQLSKGYNSKATDYRYDSVYCQTSTDATEIYLPLFLTIDNLAKYKARAGEA